MKKLHNLIQTTKLVTTKNAPVILTVVGAVGVVGTGVASVRAGYQAYERILVLRNEANITQKDLNALDYAKATWSIFLPPLAISAVSIGSIVMANRINAKRVAALAAGLAASERAYSEYKDKVLEQFGVNKEQKVKDGVAQDRMQKDPVGNMTIYNANDNGQYLCYSQYQGHYTMSSKEDLLALRNEINDTMLRGGSGYVTLSDWYSQLGIPVTPASDGLGWRQDKGLIDLDITSTLADDGRPCLAFDFTPHPQTGYDLAH